MEIKRDYRIPANWEARVDTPLMGVPIIDILPPADAPDAVIAKPPVFLPLEGEPVLNGQLAAPLDEVLPPEFVATMQDAVAHVGELALALTPAADAITMLLQERLRDPTQSQPATDQLQPNLYAAITKLNQALDHFNAVLGNPDNQSNIAKTLDQFSQASAKANRLIDDLSNFTKTAHSTTTQASHVLTNVNETVNIARADMERLGDNLIESTATLSRVLDQLLAASQDIAQGDGTIGMLLRDPKFYEELLFTTQRLGKAADELHVLVKQWQEQGLLGIR